MNKKPLGDRKRYLNIIYFFEDKKTRSLRVSVKTFNTVVVVLFFVFAGFLTSTYQWINSKNAEFRVKKQLYAAMNTIFEYQSSHDSVYELAYPAEEGPLRPEGEATNLVSTKVDKPLTFGNKESLTILSNSEKWPVAIDSPLLNRKENILDLTFSIINQDHKQKSEGYIWAVARWKNSIGKMTFLGSPGTLKVNGKGQVIDAWKDANTYSIRQFIEKNFRFTIPNNEDGHVTEVKIWMMDKKGHVAEFVVKDAKFFRL